MASIASISDLHTHTGRVYIASMNMRGKWADAPIGASKINVTSAQATLSKNRRDFSPMTPILGQYKGFWNFESYWQSGKVYNFIDHSVSLQWWKNCKEAKRRYPNSKGKTVSHSLFDGQKFNYIESRKQIYVPEYFELMNSTEMATHWKQFVASGKDVVVYDFDGPRERDGSVSCLEVTMELLRDKINDAQFPFGHGYIVAAWLLDIKPDKYCIL